MSDRKQLKFNPIANMTAQEMGDVVETFDNMLIAASRIIDAKEGEGGYSPEELERLAYMVISRYTSWAHSNNSRAKRG